MYPFTGPKIKTETPPAWSSATAAPVVDTKMECIMCTDILTLKNIVNTECNHQFCNECFWKWTKTKNTCPFCRKSMLANTKELKDIQDMRELLDHRKSIIKQVQEEYERKDDLVDDIHNLEYRNEQCKEKAILLKHEMEKLQQENEDLKTINKGSYVAMKYFQKKVNANLLFNGECLEAWTILRAKYHKIVNMYIPRIALLGQKNWLKGARKYLERKKSRRLRKQIEKEQDENGFGLDTLFPEQEEDPPNFGDHLRVDVADTVEISENIQNMINTFHPSELTFTDPHDANIDFSSMPIEWLTDIPTRSNSPLNNIENISPNHDEVLRRIGDLFDDLHDQHNNNFPTPDTDFIRNNQREV